MSKAKNNACWMVVAINGLSRSIIPLNLPESEVTKNKTNKQRQIQIKGKHTPFVELRFGIIATTAHPSPPRLLAQRDESVAVARAAE